MGIADGRQMITTKASSPGITCGLPVRKRRCDARVTHRLIWANADHSVMQGRDMCKRHAMLIRENVFYLWASEE